MTPPERERRPSPGEPRRSPEGRDGRDRSTQAGELHPTPDKEAIAVLDPFERLPLDRIELVSTATQAEAAIDRFRAARALGFDTESKPTFVKGEVSDGPHVMQFATADRAWVVLLRDPGCRAAIAAWLGGPGPAKVGFGLRDDIARIREKLGVEPQGVVDLNHVFRARGYRKDIGVKGAVAVVFGRRFAKSGKAGTSNWAAPRLSESQLLYAANDAWAALRVWEAVEPSAGPTGRIPGPGLP